MSRRHAAERREVQPDAIVGDIVLTKLSPQDSGQGATAAQLRAESGLWVDPIPPAISFSLVLKPVTPTNAHFTAATARYVSSSNCDLGSGHFPS